MLSRLKQWYRGPQPAPEAVPPPCPGHEPVALRRILLAIARVNGQGEAIRLMVDSASCEVFEFRTQGDVGEGDVLLINALLSEWGNLTVKGVVTGLIRTQRGLLGEVRLQTGEREHYALQAFLKKEAA